MISNTDVLRTLERIADLLEIKGEHVACGVVRVDGGERIAGATDEEPVEAG